MPFSKQQRAHEARAKVPGAHGTGDFAGGKLSARATHYPMSAQRPFPIGDSVIAILKLAA